MPRKSPVSLSSEKYKNLKDELDELKTIGRKLIADKLDEYRADSDNEEDAAYSDVLEQKQWIESRITELSELLEDAVVVKERESCDVASLGCTVTVKKGRSKIDVQLVSSVEADPTEKKISVESPLGSALLGKKVGDKVKVKTPKGEEEYEIIKHD